MRFIVSTEIDGRSATVDLDADGTAATDGMTVRLEPTGRRHVWQADIDGTTVPVVITSDGISQIAISLRGYTYTARVVEERHNALLAILQASPAAQSRVVRVAAPMPGLLKTILTTAGTVVKKGDTLFTLEAMKMENAIKSPIAGTIQHLTAQEGIAVEKGTLLCVVEPTH